MAPISYTDALDREHRIRLLDLAAASIEQGLAGKRLAPRAAEYPLPLQIERASFVTLNIEGQLRGCIGTLEAWRPLVLDVAENAWSAAFRDPRFSPLRHDEFERLEIHLSLLTAPEELSFESEAELLAQLVPGVDGLILLEGALRGTFLPSVWESLPHPQEFLRQLKRKAGLPADYWSDSLQISRYRTESFTY
jgi:AmmeMemoRadiSam system protein A